MSRIAYVNGRYVPHRHAMVHIEDRGYQFSDGIYEVVGVYKGQLLDEMGHLERLERSLAAIEITAPVSMRVLRLMVREIQRRNFLTQGLVYIQISRGVAPRLHTFPVPPVSPALVITAKHMKLQSDAVVRKGVSVITVPETRWARCDIKSISLLPNILAKQQAFEEGAAEAWFVDEQGCISEGTASNAWIINKDGALMTRPLSPDILGGITRAAIIKIAKEMGVSVLEKAFTLADIETAREAFITSATNYVMPVTTINGKRLSSNSFETSLQLRKNYLETMLNESKNTKM